MKKNLNKIFFGLIIVFSFFLCGFSDDKSLVSFKDEKTAAYQMSPFSIKRYEPGEPIFSDRPYYDHIKDEKLNGLFLVKIPRHLSFNIVLNLSKDTTVYRAVCNEYLKDFGAWEKTDIIMAMGGQTCVNFKVVKKNFKKGTYFFKPGGRTASPIFLKIQGGL